MKKFTVKPKLTEARCITVGSDKDSKQTIYLGRIAEVGQLVRVDYDVSNPHVVAVFGKRGSGKSYTLGSLLESLCTTEPQTSISSITKSHAVLLFDTLGIFQWFNIPLSKESSQTLIREQSNAQRGWEIQSEHLDVSIWEPRGTSSSQGQYKELTINCADFSASDWGYLFGVDILQDRMGQLLNDAYEKVVNEGWSDGRLAYSPKQRYAIEDIIDCIKNDTELLTNYHGETRRAVLQQFNSCLRNPLFQPKRKPPTSLKSSIEKGEMPKEVLNALESAEGTFITDLLKPGQLSILLLHKMSDELRFILIVSLIRKIMHARMETAELEKSLRILPSLTEDQKASLQGRIQSGVPPTWIVADEAQNFLPSERKTTATDVLIRLVREGRNFGLSFMLTTQQPTAIDSRILAQVDTMIVHKLAVQGDIEYVKRNMKSALPEEVRYGNSMLSFDDLLRSLDVGQAVISNTETSRAFIIDVRPRVSVHGGFGI